MVMHPGTLLFTPKSLVNVPKNSRLSKLLIHTNIEYKCAPYFYSETACLAVPPNCNAVHRDRVVTVTSVVRSMYIDIISYIQTHLCRFIVRIYYCVSMGAFRLNLWSKPRHSNTDFGKPSKIRFRVLFDVGSQIGLSENVGYFG